mmetsp:Transcript_18106/g.49993  ORF Transcript_18106/g.49993 Transcript_18106/m.49993 type:complete len:213 (-) Transcript_18106:235-873(-)
MPSVSSTQLPPTSAFPVTSVDAAIFVLAFCSQRCIKSLHVCVSAQLHARMSSRTLAARAMSRIASSTPLSGRPVSISMPWVAVSSHFLDSCASVNPRSRLSSSNGVSLSGTPPAKSGSPSSFHFACNAASSSAPVANPTRSVLPWQHIATVLKVPCSFSKPATTAESPAGTDWKSQSATTTPGLTAAFRTSGSSTSEQISTRRFREVRAPEK